MVRQWERTNWTSFYVIAKQHRKFKPEPEDEHARATAVNFAAAYKRSERKSVKSQRCHLGKKRSPTIQSRSL